MNLIGVENHEPLPYHKSCTLLLIPSLWALLPTMLKCRPRLMLTSGSSLGKHREDIFLNLRKTLNTETKLIEILGSTETGGFGFREIGVHAEKTFQLFSSCKIILENGYYKLSSPYTFNSFELFELEDKLELINENTFIHEGRKDKIFKYGGKRFSLREVEINMKKYFDCDVKCFFEEDEALAKGGNLIAFIECAQVDSKNLFILQKKYSKENSTPFPNSTYFIEKFLANAMGKVTLNELLKLKS